MRRKGLLLPHDDSGCCTVKELNETGYSGEKPGEEVTVAEKRLTCRKHEAFFSLDIQYLTL